ncbi:MAG: TonB-dependent receptor [Candidatus Omnitrophica bacterium]|nr:TonB-dependent receptor [Candidatus Omnitrophota bacterium]
MKKSFICFLMVLVGFTAQCQDAFADIETEMDTVVVTATRIAQHNYKIAGNVTVITKEEIEASNAQNVPDILKESLGIHIFDKNTSKTAVVDMRGFGDSATSNVLVLVNDRKINAVDISGADLIQVPIEAVERIEIIRGAGSVLYGDNAVGGVVNIITKKGEGEFSGKLGGVYGSYDTRGTDLEVSGEKNNVSYFFYAKYFDQRGYRQNSDVLTDDFSTRLGYAFSDKISMDFNFGWHEDRYGLPGGLNATELESMNRRESAEPENYATTKDKHFNLSFDVNPWPEDVYFGDFVLNLFYRDRDVFDDFFGSQTDRATDTKGINVKYIFDHTIFDKEVNFVTGIDYYDHENDIIGKGSNAVDLTISKEEFGVYGFAQYELLENVFVNGGTRYHKADYAFSQRDVAIDEKQSPDEFVSMVGMKYEYAQGSNAHFNVQQTFRFLSTDEWYSSSNFPDWGITPNLNTDLEQQTGIQYEVGIKHNFNDKLIVSVTPYWMDLKNEIFFDPVKFVNTNYDKTRRIGVEVGQKVDLQKFFEIDFLDKLEFFANYTYQNPQFRDGANDGKDIPIVPRHQASTGIISEFFKNYHVSLMGRYVGSRFAINDTLNATSPIKPYFVLDGKVAYERDNFEVYLAINNILDRKYHSYVAKSAFSSAKDYYPAAEQNFTFGANVKF